MQGIIENRIEHFRQKEGMTQEELAHAVGVTRQTIIALEKGNYTPSVLLALRIAKFFRKSVEQLFHITPHC
jgi:putative transcriptional regulator